MPNKLTRKSKPVAPMASYAIFTDDGFCKPIVSRYGAWALNIAIRGHNGNLNNRHAEDFSIISRWIDGDLVTRYATADEHVAFHQLTEQDQNTLFNGALGRLRYLKQHDRTPDRPPYGNARTTGDIASQYEPTPQTQQEADDADEYAFLDEPIDADLEPAI